MSDHFCPGEFDCAICNKRKLQESPQLLKFIAENRMPDCFEPTRGLIVALALMCVEAQCKGLN